MMNAIIFCKNACFFFYNLQPKISMILVLNIHVNKTYIPSSSAVLHFLFCSLFLCQSPCSASGESETKPQNLKQLTGRPSKLDKWKKGAEIPSVHHADDHLMKFTAWWKWGSVSEQQKLKACLSGDIDHCIFSIFLNIISFEAVTASNLFRTQNL